MFLNVITKFVQNRASRLYAIPKPQLSQISRKSTTFTSQTSENETRRKTIQTEVFWWHSTGLQCPDPTNLTNSQWDHLLGLNSKTQRQKYCRHLCARTVLKAEQQQKRNKRKDERKGIKEQTITERKENKHLVYGLGGNSLFQRINKQTMHKWCNAKLRRAKLFGQKLIIDCTFDEKMNDRELIKVGNHLVRSFSTNRKHRNPFDLHLCGVDLNSIHMKQLHQQIPQVYDKSFLLSIHTECFSTLFPKERIMILSPNSDTDLEYNSADIYVLGAIVDLGPTQHLTLTKAKALGVRSARLPLHHIQWAQGSSKELPFSSVAGILRDLQRSRDWKTILEKNVPRHKQANCVELVKKNSDEKQ